MLVLQDMLNLHLNILALPCPLVFQFRNCFGDFNNLCKFESFNYDTYQESGINKKNETIPKEMF